MSNVYGELYVHDVKAIIVERRDRVRDEKKNGQIFKHINEEE